MPSLSSGGASRAWAFSLSLVWLLVAVPMPASAAETASSEIVIIRPDDVVEDDLYAGAVRVLIEGEIQGDLVVAAAEEVLIEGTVTGTVSAVAPQVRVDGTVGGSLRAVAGVVRVAGQVAGDVVVAGGSSHLEPGSSIGGDVLAWVSELRTAGNVMADLGGSMRVLHLGGSIGGEVDVSVGTLIASESLTVTGDLGYRSERVGQGLEAVEVGGSVVHRQPLPPNIRVRAIGLFGRLMLVLFLSISALLAAYLWPRRTEAAIKKVATGPLRSWLLGGAVFVAPVAAAAAVVAVVLLAPPTSAIPLALVSLPVLLALFGVAIAVSVAAGVPAVGRLGALVWRDSDLYVAVLTGSIIAGALWLIPVVGWLVPVIVLPLGLGGWLRSETPAAPTVSDTPA